LTHITKAGSHVSCHLCITALRDPTKRIIGYLLIGASNTDQVKSQEQEIREQLFYMRELIDANIDAIWVVNTEGMVIDVNQQTETLTGLTRQKLLGAPFRNHFTVPSMADACVKMAVTGGRAVDYDLTTIHVDGTHIGVFCSAGAYYDRNRRLLGILVSARDVTDIKQALQQLADKQIELQKVELKNTQLMADIANKAKSSFLANISHEIRTPMNVIIGMTHVAQMTEMTTHQRACMTKIQSAGKILLGLINDVLDFSKADAGEMGIEKIPFTLDSILKNVAAMTEDNARSSGLALRFVLAADVQNHWVGDPLRLSQILINYVKNAVKFTPSGRVTVNVERVDQALGTVGDTSCLLRFEVEDTGIGLTEEQISRLFMPFEQADNSTTRKYGGTGLGLVICKQLAQLMGGEVGVSSRLGEGSQFWFTVSLEPSLAVTSEAAQSEVDTASDSAATLRGMRMLVVDDNDFNLDVAEGIFNSVGMQVVLASNGAQAIELLRQSQFDCVLMDVQMPVMDGLQATRIIRADSQLAHTCVIGFTANAGGEDRTKCLAAGMNAVATKPIEPEILFALVAKLTTAALRKNLTTAALQPALSAELAVWDADALTRLVGDQPATHERLLKKFLSTANGQITALTEAATFSNWLVVSEQAHKLKSAAKAVGALRLEASCKAIEEACLAGNIAPCLAMAARLVEDFLQAQDKILLVFKL
jgi:PAS domain S-box-containing protein